MPEGTISRFRSCRPVSCSPTATPARELSEPSRSSATAWGTVITVFSMSGIFS